MIAFIRAFLSYKPAKFESTVDRWERKGLLKPFGQPKTSTLAPRKQRDIVDTVMALLERATAARMSVTGTRYPPNRWRLRRLYRWQQRHECKSPREDWTAIAIALASLTRSSD